MNADAGITLFRVVISYCTSYSHPLVSVGGQDNSVIETIAATPSSAISTVFTSSALKYDYCVLCTHSFMVLTEKEQINGWKIFIFIFISCLTL